MSHSEQELRKKIVGLVKEYHDVAFAPRPFAPGVSPIPVSGKVFDHLEIEYLIDSSLDFWLTTGRFAEEFEKKFADFFNLRFARLVNSGSSANLLALAALTSPSLGPRAIRPGDELITVGCGFPTTVNPAIQHGMVPVFVDIEIPTYNIDVRYLKEALSEKSKAIMIAHTLGNPFDVETVSNFAKEHDLWLIEDTCDALGSTYKGKLAGTYGDLATLSFYPAHHLTMGEGGCVLMNSPTLKKLVESFRDWGRDCWCEPGKDNTCGKRFCWKMGELPEGYDHKYIYSHIGYNLKLTDMQAAIGLAQLTKVSDFIQKRKDNFSFLCAGLRELEEYLILPEATQHSDPSWFGFPISIRESAPFCRNDVVAYLNNKQIATRLLFGGNLIKQPAYRNIQHRIIGELRNCDFVMNQCFWIGVYPGLTREMLEFVIETFREGLRSNFRI